MPTISEDDTYIEIVVFDTQDATQQHRLLEGVLEQVEGWVKGLPGFLSASFHRSADGLHVANYAQWRSRADWEAFTRDPRSGAIGSAIRGAGVAKGAGHGYRVARIVVPGDG